MTSTPKGLRTHIGIFGRRNAGKSTLINALTGQAVSIVSEQPGTTTDPVEKAFELAPLGPVLFIDTAGFDDVGALGEQRVKKIYFTGMLTHGQSDFFIQYIDPESRTVRSYYPDFIFQREEPDGSLKYVIVEVKADNQIEDAVVQAKKDFAQQIAVASGMEYQIIKSIDADKRHYRLLM